MPITVEVPNRGSIEFADGTSDADIDAIVAKEFPPTQEDSYQKVLGYEQSISDEVPTKEEFLAYNKVKKGKPLLGEMPMETVAGAAVETGKFLATLPYRAGEAISETVILPPEGVTRGEAVAGTAAEIAAQAKLGADRLMQGLQNFFAEDIEKTASRLGIQLKNEDEKYSAFLQLADIKRKLAAAQALESEQRVPASQEFLQAYGIPQEAISPAGTEVGGFAAAPENIAFGLGGALAGQLARQAAIQIPRLGAAAQRAGAAVGNVARMPETLAGRAATALTGSEAAGEAVQRAVATGTTGLTAAEAFGVPVSGTLGVPGVGAASQFISGTKAAGAIGETLGEAAAASGGAGLTPIQQAMLGFGERIAASPTASTAARRLGTAIARTGIETPVKAAASILIPGLGAGAAGGLLAGLSGEESENVAAAIGSGIAFGGIEGGIRLAKASSAKGFDNARVRQAVVDDLNTRPNDVQFTYVDPVAGDQTVTIKDRDARAAFYNKLQGDNLPKALSEVANAENAGIDVLFHRDSDPIPKGIQQIKYKGVALKPADVRGGRPTILINVDAASPETIPHELLHARLTDDIVRRAGANVVQDSFDAQTGKITQQGQQFQDFANSYATAIEKAGDPTGAARFRQELATGFDNTLQRPQRIEALKRLSDEMMTYYAQEFLAGKDPKTLLPGRIPSFWKNAFDLAKNAVADRFSQRALQAGFDPVARTFYDANGKRIKIPWMEDAINQLIIKGEGFTPREQKVDLRGLTPAARNAVIADRGYADLFMLNPDGSFGRPLTAREVQINDARIAQSTIKLLDSLPQADRASVTGLDAKGNTIIEGRLSLKEAEALANSGIFSTSTSQFIKDIANAIINGDLLNSRYWKVYGKTGRAGVFPEVEKAILPYGISINSKGGVNVKVVDWTKVQSRMDKALKKSAYRNLFRSQDQAMSALLDVYLKNIAENNAVPSAEALGGGAEGARKRNFFNEVMGAVPKVGDVLINQPTAGYTASRKGGSVYEDLRIERVQDIEQTGIKVPWSGDMGEQSSYRRTQLNFQPAERVGDASVQTDQNAGYRILSKNNKFRVYSPSGELAGIFDTEGQAKLKAEKLYATEARLQPEIDQQQRPQGNEGRQTAEAGGRNRIERRTQGSQAGGEVNQPVRQAGDVGRFMPDQQGFYSKLEEVVTNKLPKSATPQQILATVDPAKGSGVKAEELKWTGFAQAVERIAKENGGKVPKEKLMEHLQNEGRVRFEEVNRGVEGYYITQDQVDGLERIAQRTQSEEDWRAYENAVLQFESQELGTEAQYSKYQLPGGQNYREVVLTSDTAAPYTSSHFKDIPNYVAHMRVNERAGPDGKPGLFIEEIQSDRHQQAREKGYKTDFSEIQKQISELQDRHDKAYQEWKPKLDAAEKAKNDLLDLQTEILTPYYKEVGAKNFSELLILSSKSPEAKSLRENRISLARNNPTYKALEAKRDALIKEADKYSKPMMELSDKIRSLESQIKESVPDAPFRKDWSLQMFKRGLRDAVASGKEWIGWTTGIEQVKRYEDEFRKSVDTIRWNDEGLKHNVVAIKDGQEVFSGRFDSDGKGLQLFNGEEASLSDVVGKDIAAQIIKGEGKARGVDEAEWSGSDLTIGGEGMKGFYDQILPSEVQKYVKQWGGEVKKSNIPEAPIWRVDITPQMRESVQKTGQPRFMPSDTDYLAAVQAGDTQAAQQMVDQAAKAAGYTVGPVYHGTPTGGFNVFDKRMRGETSGVSRQAFSFTTDQKAAENYSKRLGDEAVRLDAGLRVANDAMRRFDDDVAAQEYFSSKGYTSVEDGMLPEFDWGAIDDVPEFIRELRGHAKDLKPINPDLASSFIEAAKVMSSTKAVPEVKRVFLRIPEDAPVFQATPATLGQVMSGFSAEKQQTKAGIVELPRNERIYYVADSSQVKLADPVTKDAQGNVIPLSQRFQQSSADIRYMPQPDPSIPGAYSVTGGFRILPGKTGGRLRVYGPSGALVGIAGSLDEAQRMIRRKTKTN